MWRVWVWRMSGLNLNFVLWGFHYEDTFITLGRTVFGGKFFSSYWEVRKKSMQCNVEFGCELRIFSKVEKTHVKFWSNWLVPGPSGYVIIYSQPYGLQINELYGQFLWHLKFLKDWLSVFIVHTALFLTSQRTQSIFIVTLKIVRSTQVRYVAKCRAFVGSVSWYI